MSIAKNYLIAVTTNAMDRLLTALTMLSWFGQATVLLWGGFEYLNVFIRWIGPWLFFSPLSSMPRIDARSIVGNDYVIAHEISRQKTSFIGSCGFSKFVILFCNRFFCSCRSAASFSPCWAPCPACCKLCWQQIFYTRQISLVWRVKFDMLTLSDLCINFSLAHAGGSCP